MQHSLKLMHTDQYWIITMHVLEKVNLGAGSRSPDKRKTIGETARITSVKPKYGRLLYRIALHYKPACIIELGSAFGISTMYLALGNSQASVITVEGNPQVAGIAVEGYNYMGISNITMLQNSFDKVVPELSPIQEKSTLVFIDGNHTMEATLEYYGKFRANMSVPLILIFDDINWSSGMMKAWKKITSSLAGETCIDLFQMGIVFAGYGTAPGRYYLYY